jgi:hypothetical protein
MYSVRLIKVTSNHENLRTNETVGLSHDLPEMGQPFTLLGDPLTSSAGVRVIRTTPVVKVDVIGTSMKGMAIFETENSVYKVFFFREKSEYIN